MGIMKKLELTIAESREKVLAPLLLTKPSPDLSKQVIRAYLKTQAQLYQLMLESTRHLNRFEAEQLPAVVASGCEMIENLTTLLNERSRLKYSESEPAILDDKLSKVNRRILELLEKKPSRSLNRENTKREDLCDDEFKRMLTFQASRDSLAPLFDDIMEAKEKNEIDSIAEFRLTLDTNTIKQHRKLKTRPQLDKYGKAASHDRLLHPSVDLKLPKNGTSHYLKSESKTSEARLYSSILREKMPRADKNALDSKMKGPAIQSTLNHQENLMHEVPEISDICDMQQITAKFFQSNPSFAILDSPVVAQQLTFDNIKVANRSKDFGIKLVLPVLLHLLLNRYKRKFFKRCKADLAVALRNLEIALKEERLKNDVLVQVLSGSKNSLSAQWSNPLARKHGDGSRLFVLDSARMDTELPLNIGSNNSLQRSINERHGSHGSEPDFTYEASLRAECWSKQSDRYYEDIGSEHKRKGIGQPRKPVIKYSIKDFCDLTKDSQPSSQFMQDKALRSNPILNIYSKKLEKDCIAHSSARKTALHFKNLAENLSVKNNRNIRTNKEVNASDREINISPLLPPKAKQNDEFVQKLVSYAQKNQPTQKSKSLLTKNHEKTINQPLLKPK